MKTNRRNFIKTASLGSLGFGLLPHFTPFPQEFLWDSIFNENYPKMSFPRKSPESQGISSKGISDFIKAANVSGLEWHSFMLLRHGNVVAEGWWKPFQSEFKHTLYSLSKSFTSTAIGLLVKEGKLSVEDPVLSFFKEDTPEAPSENLKAMKVKHLLTMNTGHDVDTMPKIREKTQQAWTKSFLEVPVVHQPSTHFLYNTGATYMLGAILHKITGQTLEQYLTPRLFQPLGITDFDWEKSPQGLNTAGWGLRIKTEDIAKLGQLYLQKGKWQGKEILTEGWVNDATSKQTTSQAGDGDWAQGYGYQFWRCKPNGLYRGDGAFGQYCIVMPEQDVVLAITGESWNMQKSMTIAWETLLPAISNTVLAENTYGTSRDNREGVAALNNELKNLVIAIPKGSKQSSPSAKYDDKDFTLEKNVFGADEAEFLFSKEGCTLEILTKEGEVKLKFGWENWLLNKKIIKNPFNGGSWWTEMHVPSRIAGTATWLNDNTLQLTMKFVETIHSDTLTCVFDSDKVTISFLNSVSANTKGVDTRQKLAGILKK